MICDYRSRMIWHLSPEHLSLSVISSIDKVCTIGGED